MAYLREIVLRTCYAHGCGRRASQTLFGERNEPLGDYCARHAHQALRAYSERRGTVGLAASRAAQRAGGYSIGLGDEKRPEEIGP